MAGEFKIHVMEPDLILMIDDDGGEPIASYADRYNAIDEVVKQFRGWLIREGKAQRIRREALARRARFAVVTDTLTTAPRGAT